MPFDPGWDWQDIRPNHEPPKPWWRLYPKTLVMGIVQVVLIIHFFAVIQLNPAPDAKELIRIPVKVLGIQELDPHLHVRLEDGSQRMMEFPSLSLTGRSSYYGLTREAQKALVGCEGYVDGTPMHLVLGNRFRVWRVQCGNDVRLTLQKSTADYESLSRISKQVTWGYVVLALFITAFIFWVERRDEKRNKS